jgi:HJR/Mrr/RecB family endonuclease
MKPEAFERVVARHLETEGYATSLTPTTNDWGVDIFSRPSTIRPREA